MWGDSQWLTDVGLFTVLVKGISVGRQWLTDVGLLTVLVKGISVGRQSVADRCGAIHFTSKRDHCGETVSG